jgi:hypothetical protein
VPVKTVVFASLALATEPLVFFLLYFCARHSFRHLKAGFHAEREGGRLSTLMVVVYTVVPILIVGVMPAWLGPDGTLSDQILQVVFIGLAELTVPLMIVETHENRHRRALIAPDRC